MLSHFFRSLSHPAFREAMDWMVVSCNSPGDAFGAVRGIHAAVVLAGWGLPVAPLDLATNHVKAKPSRDLDDVQAVFAAAPSAFVGYNTCEAPFYLLLTDCISTLRRLIPVHPLLAELKEVYAREGAFLPPDRGQPFTHGMAVINRRAEDAISSVVLADVDPNGGGSTILFAGWQENGKSYGAPNAGYVPVPGQLLKALVRDPRVAHSFWLNAAASPAIH